MAPETSPPGPPSVPLCSECGAHPMRRHKDGCTVSEANDRHWGNVRAVEKTLADAIAEKRADREFMERLRARVVGDKTILDRLAVGPTPAGFDALTADIRHVLPGDTDG